VNLEGSLNKTKQTLASKEQEEASFNRSMRYMNLSQSAYYHFVTTSFTLRELEVKNLHLTSTNLTLKKETADSKSALAEHHTEHQNCMASFAVKCSSYEREIGKRPCLECRIVELTLFMAFWYVLCSYVCTCTQCGCIHLLLQ